MIEKVKIEGFQGIRGEEFVFAEGLNAFVGMSDKGKSSALRAISWPITNKPSGVGFISNKTSTGPKAKFCRVTLWINDHKIERYKDRADKNYYRVDDSKTLLTGFGQSVPKAVQDICNMGVVNIQKQHLPYYLLSMSAGDTAKELNSILDLQRINKAVAIANRKQKEINKELDAFNYSLRQKKSQLIKYDALQGLERLETEIRDIIQKTEQKSRERSRIVEYIASFRKVKAELAKYKELPLLSDKRGLVNEKLFQLKEKQKLADRLSNTKENIKKIEKELVLLSDIPDFSIVKKNMGVIKEKGARKKVINTLIEKLKEVNNGMEAVGKLIDKEKNKFDEYKETVSICPLCKKELQ